MITALIPLILSVVSIQYQTGPLSVYKPNDGHNAGWLACGGRVRYSHVQVHIAHRAWRKLGCGRPVYVYVPSTGKSRLTTVRDGGPYGITNRAGDWRVWTRTLHAPRGWRFRGLTDLSWALWKQLGKPRFLSKAVLLFVSTPKRRYPAPARKREGRGRLWASASIEDPSL